MILIGDKGAALRRLVRATLKRSGRDVVAPHDGVESLEPDLIPLELMMPGRKRFHVRDDLRREQALEATPVIVRPARAQVADRDAMRPAGTTRFVTKPFSPGELHAEVTRLPSERR